MDTRFGFQRRDAQKDQERRTISNLTSKRTFERGYKDVTKIQPLISDENKVELHVPATPKEALKLIYATLREMANTDDPKQKSAYLGTVFCSFFVEMQRDIIDAFLEIGVTTEVIGSATERLEQGLVLDTELDYQMALVLLGQACLIMFKQININSYDNFMKSRTKALYALAGLNPDDPNLRIFFTCEQAAQLSRIFGTSLMFKSKLVKRLMASAEGLDRTNIICNYVVNIISWNEMSSITFIYDTLLLTRSPVLKVLEINNEVRNLEHALKTIASTDFPAFFKSLSSPALASVMERSRFPTLIEVARRLKIKVTDTVDQFASARPDQGKGTTPATKLVNDLVDLHNAYMKGRMADTSELVSFLYSAGDDNKILEEEERDALPHQRPLAPEGGDA